MGGNKFFLLLAVILILFYLFAAVAFAGEVSGRIDAGPSTTTSTYTTGQLPPSGQGGGGASADVPEPSLSSTIVPMPGVEQPLSGQPVEGGIRSSGGGGIVACTGPVGGEITCTSFEAIEIKDGEAYATATPTFEGSVPVMPLEDEASPPIVYDNIEETLLDAVGEALAANPEHVFHLKISMKEEYGQEIPWEKLSSIYEKENRAIIRGIDRDNNIMYVDAPASEVYVLSYVWIVYLIEFDPAFEIPSFPKPEPTKKPELETPLIDINFEIENKFGSITISKKADTNVLIIDSNGIKAETSKPVRVDENGLKLEEKNVKVLPNQAVQKMETQINATAKNIILSISKEVPVYEIQAVQKARLFWIIPVEMEIKTTVNAQNGKIEKIEKPWWSFLVG